MHISKRILNIANLIPDNSNVIDVGCDHAFLDIYLTINKKCRCLATDISASALKSARANIKKYKLDKEINTLKTDGLENIDIKKDDYIVIAGMGTGTIKHILKEKSLSDNLVISTHNELDVLRAFVINLGYFITDEIFFFDKEKPYVVIKFKKGTNNYNSDDIIYGPILRYNKEYITYLKNNLNKIKKQVPFFKFKLKRTINKKIKKLDKISS